jgi:hypothetical protein
MISKRLLGAAAFSLALAGGGVAGAMLGTPGVSGAQDPTDDTATEDAPVEDAPGFRAHGPRGERLETAAEALGMSADELKTELEAGKSIAQVAEEKGVDVQTVVDALVAEGMARLEQLEAELPDRVAELVEREGLPERRGPHGPRGERPAHTPAGAEDDPAAGDS